MKKSVLTIIIAVIVVVALVFSIYKLTGSSIKGLPGKCTDTDGLDYFVKGNAKYENRPTLYTDFCVEGETKKLNEYYCPTDITLKAKRVWCDIACKDGVCVK